jgi:hypothetical protein
MGKPEEHQEGLALEVLIAEGRTILVGQPERPTDRCRLQDSGAGSGAAGASQKQDDAEAKPKPCQESRKHDQ